MESQTSKFVSEVVASLENVINAPTVFCPGCEKEFPNDGSKDDITRYCFANQTGFMVVLYLCHNCLVSYADSANARELSFALPKDLLVAVLARLDGMRAQEGPIAPIE